MLWENKNDEKINNQLRSEMWSSNVMREKERSKEQWSIEKWNS
jgi:hypothetical protein